MRPRSPHVDIGLTKRYLNPGPPCRILIVQESPQPAVLRTPANGFFMPRLRSSLTLLCLAFGVLPTAAAEPGLSFRDVQPWLASHCYRCHGVKQKRGKVDLSVFREEAGVLKQRKLWQRVLIQVETQEMPPATEPQLSAAQREQLTGWVRQTLASAEPANPAERNPGKAPIRRLTRTEYNNTLRDLFVGLSFDAAAVGMPEDVGGQSFDNLAAALSLPPALMDKYFAAADKVLDEVFPFPDGSSKPKNPRAFEALVGKRDPMIAPRDAARQVLERFLPRAYRRPIEAREIRAPACHLRRRPEEG